MIYRYYVQEHYLDSGSEKLIPIGSPRFFQAVAPNPSEGLIKVRAQVNASDLKRPTIRSA